MIFALCILPEALKANLGVTMAYSCSHDKSILVAEPGKVDDAEEPVAPLRKAKKKGKKGKQVDVEAMNDGQAPPAPGGEPFPVSV